MDHRLFSFLCCPVTRSPLHLQTISLLDDHIVSEGILFADEDWFYPVIKGLPRLNVEAFLDYEDFFRLHMTDYSARRQQLKQKYPGLIAYVTEKNRKTKESFSLEWSLHDYSEDRTWAGEKGDLLQRFLEETGETANGLKGKIILDAGCGNGQLDTFIAAQGATVVAMDLSTSIERAYWQNTHPDACFIQGDLQFPPVKQELFDIVHCSGVLHHTNNTELSFSCLAPCVRSGGTYSVWLYHPRDNFLHNFFNFLRHLTSRLPARWTYRLLACTALPVIFVWKWMKGNRQNKREIMIELMDWFSPQYRREHTIDETASWYAKRGYHSMTVTTRNIFGFNMTGKK
jgi:2-polyprenyl-3-methyl-5-hydroxy-6-metoxy-1,4-benzoquinol methylase/uncharacterized protein YbaR (Trm112 family)